MVVFIFFILSIFVLNKILLVIMPVCSSFSRFSSSRFTNFPFSFRSVFRRRSTLSDWSRFNYLNFNDAVLNNPLLIFTFLMFVSQFVSQFVMRNVSRSRRTYSFSYTFCVGRFAVFGMGSMFLFVSSSVFTFALT